MSNDDEKYFLGIGDTQFRWLFNAHIPERYQVVLKEIVNIICDIQVNKNFSQVHVDKLEEGFRINWNAVWYDFSGKIIARLAHDFAETENLLLKLWDDKSSKIRFKIATLIGQMPIAIEKKIICEALNDKSKEVRCATASQIRSHEYIHYADLLQKSIEKECNEKARELMLFHLDLLLKGSGAIKMKDGSIAMARKTDGGMSLEFTENVK